MIYSTYSYLEISLIKVICIYGIFESNLGIKMNFANYLKKSGSDIFILFMPRDFFDKCRLHL